MDLSGFLWIQIVIFSLLGIVYVILVKKRPKKSNRNYSSPDWNFDIKRLWALYQIKQWKKSRANEEIKLENAIEEKKFVGGYESSDAQVIWGANSEGSSIYISFRKKMNRTAEVSLILTMADGTMYRLPNQPDTMVFDASSQSWNAGDLRLVLVEPFTRWRIIFNGYLVKGCKDKWNSEEEHEEMQHVKMNFIWICACDPLRIPDDSSDYLLANSIALEPWKSPNWMDGIKNHPIKGYDQYGALTGIIAMDQSEKQLTYSSMRQRKWGPTNSSFIRRSLNIMGTTVDGTMYNIGVESNRIGLTQYQYGNVRFPNGRVYMIDWTDIDMSEIGEYPSNVRKAFTIKFKAGGKHFTSVIHLKNSQTNLLRGGRPWDWESLLIPTQIGTNGYQGFGFLELWYRYDGDCPLHTPFTEIKQLQWRDIKNISTDKLCASFKEKASCCPQFVGAKGASLALLSSIYTDKYKIPNGFCITSKALDVQMDANKSLFESIATIEKINENYSEQALKTSCENATKLFSNTELYDSVKEQVHKYYDELCELVEARDKLYFAVRSSGIGEDSEELSAAGQNATILGCKSFEEVCKAVQQCWASLFTFQSVEYRRQHGQRVNCGMGVVVQQMVDAQAAGVMFTRHPTTGNPGNILITSNYGLGETVVSGEVEPDTIIISKDIKNNLKIFSIEIGKKSHKISLDALQNTTEDRMKKTILDSESKDISLSNDECLALGKIAIEQEALWGAPRDIEWAIAGGIIYLVQARPITSLQAWTEYELLHELDTPIMSNDDLITFANTGEVMPSVYTPLSYSTIAKALDDGITPASGNHLYKYSYGIMSSTHHRIGLNVINTMLRNPEKEITFGNKVMDIALYGHIVTDEKLHSIGVHRHNIMGPILQSLLLLGMVKELWIKDKVAAEATKFANNYNINLDDCKTSLEMLSIIEHEVSALIKVSFSHNTTSSASFFSQLIFFSILIEGGTDFSMENYTDIATVLSSCANVISAEVPKGLSKLARSIKSTNKHEKFCKIDPEQGSEWLKLNCPESYGLFVEFLRIHGHRAIGEFDLATHTWEMDPRILISTLQTTLSANLKEEKASTNEDLVSKLVSPMKNTTKKILSYVIPTCQKSVSCREATKAALILVLHKHRLAYRKLALQMVKEWKMPDVELIFYFTRNELHRYIVDQDPGHLNKAMLRRRYFQKWKTYKFPELNWGVPKPINTSYAIVNDTGECPTVTGTPVCSGSIVGRACVVHNLSEIGQLKNGDILITSSTDIGWSPYFPLLGGVVTELGGLISHGAVVAREYGLPCIVGAQCATSIFKTGDTVILDSVKGMLQKIEQKID